jgi:hypothetical protein
MKKNEVSKVEDAQVQSHLEAPKPVPIEAIEFYSTDDKYGEINIDQLYNLPSIIMSKANIDAIYNKKLFANMKANDLYKAYDCNLSNMRNIVKNMLYWTIDSNLKRYLSTNTIFRDILINDIYNMSWFELDRMNESRNASYNHSVESILRNSCLSFQPMYSCEKDSVQDFERASAIAEVSIDQLYVLISTTITDFLNRIIDKNRGLIVRNTDFILVRYAEEYSSMKQLFSVLSRDDALILMVKQIVSLDLFGWCENALRPMISNIIRNTFYSGYYMWYDLYNSAFKKENEEFKALEDTIEF